MRRTGLYFILLLVVIALLSCISLACSKSSNPTSQTQPVSSGVSGTTPLGDGKTSTTTSTGGTASVAVPGGMPDIADNKSLPAYRLTITTKMLEPTSSVTYMKYEWVRDQKAEHAWMEDASGKVTEVYIKIGDKEWIWMGLAGMGWIEQPPRSTPTTSTIPSDLASQIKQMQQDVAHAKVRFDKKGTETVNSVRCTRYEFEYSVTTEIPNLATGGTRKAVEHSSGDMWIADQSGVPAVMIKSKNISEITIADDKTVMDMDYNLTDIGAAITIKPPEGAMQIPTGLPTPPTDIPTLPFTPKPTTSPPTTTITATPSPTGGIPTFNDNFQGNWNSNFVWTDPNNDVTFSFTARPGFLRLTVPDNNDLAGVMNYDAPRLLIPQDGDFTIETLVEFDPEETYQGAGLLVWQNEDIFLRLEFGYGGMGGSEKNVVFVWGENGGLGLAGSVDLPDTLKRIELRLQRNGDQFTTWYREVNGIWLEIGTTELNLNPTVEVGLAQVTQYTPSEISADFDYFRVFTP